jgi:leucyl aminopeptidase
MKIVLGSAGPKTAVDALAVLVTEDDVARDELVSELDAALGGALRSAIKDEEFTAKKDTLLVLPTFGKIAARKIALIGIGSGRKLAAPDVRAAAVKATRWGIDRGATLAIALPRRSTPETIRAVAEGVQLGAYRFIKYLTGDRIPKKALTEVTLGMRANGGKEAGRPQQQHDALARGISVGESVNLVRDLVNEPPNELTPAALAQAAKDVAKKHKMQITVLDRKGIIGAGMKLLDAVGRGSVNEQRFVHMVYTPAKLKKNRKKIALVGKGLTFDSGGLCIKQAAGMGDMKCDMAGAGITVGVMHAVAALQLDVEVHGIFAAAENMPDGGAYRPGDIFGSLDGKTVEIINTDAEGRLVLADALAYARKLGTDYIIDHATLTGACMIALGPNCAGLYGNDDRLARSYVQAADRAGESMWHMPLLEDLREGLKTDVADLKHTGDRYGGSITGALFLREFVGDSKWLHLDIAGPAFADRVTVLSPKGATGFGVLAFIQFLESIQ